ncbi:MAG: dihydroneopterin aldolase [Candidatus Magasanikbacteria bacterium CG11_big_fil_rev_8_21_14_0_20_39_34]|uniref:7,8-dihydroneopterin aldolase n=1 Tax=Candidatus Magasanikbacteria bacterium CG11_big_fil_rev_8_21_14_0_20_39_34 TaxID=1974653 RepID=A0A2H0N8L4_9BACT|nr:MAG: dihydroneopterin aldolase [Candidatus Magasanikbacteria bacterium CG11_big_fil_rev_8_21_14_0_20_39_34]
MKDKIILDNAKFFVHLGVSEKELKKKQPIFVTIELLCDIRSAAKEDDIEKTFNWEQIHERMFELISSQQWRLVETLAEKLASCLLKNFSPQAVRVRVEKPSSLKGKKVHFCAVDIERKP